MQTERLAFFLQIGSTEPPEGPCALGPLAPWGVIDMKWAPGLETTTQGESYSSLNEIYTHSGLLGFPSHNKVRIFSHICWSAILATDGSDSKLGRPVCHGLPEPP